MIILSFCNLGKAQEIKSDECIQKSDLIGYWELKRIHKPNEPDSVFHAPSMAPLGLTDAEPVMVIDIDTIGLFRIEQICMKCPYINWTGEYFLDKLDTSSVDLTYLRFVENRDRSITKKMRKRGIRSFTAKYNGYIKSFSGDKFELIDERNYVLTYQRK